MALGLSCNKLLHLGRNLGAKILDLLEEFKEEKRSMGQWSPDVVDNSYSSKLPMRQMRKLAGHTGKSSMYFNTRTTVEPSEELLRTTPMGKWCYDACAAVFERVSVTGKNQTALQFLKFVCYLNTVFVQDAAALLHSKPNRVDHPMHRDIDTLRSSQFKSFKQQMHHELSTEDSPLDANLEKVLPGLYQWHNITVGELNKLKGEVNRLSETMKGVVSDFVQSAKSDRHAADKRIAVAFRRLAEAYESGDGGAPARPAIEEAAALLGDNQTELTAPSTSDDESEWDDLRKPMASKHNTLRSLHNEWHGLDEHEDSWGGVAGREAQQGSKWRKGLVNPQHFSRTKRIIVGIKKYAEREGKGMGDSVADLEAAFAASNKSIAKFVKVPQQMELVGERAARGSRKKMKDDSSSNNNNNDTTCATEAMEI